jgi:hypothetical protein
MTRDEILWTGRAQTLPAGFDLGQAVAPLPNATALPVGVDPKSLEKPMGGDIRGLILETADELGMDPHTLATIISYETAGTFDPMKRGPTTQWGQHRGLIQFGEPQAAENGVDFSSPEAALRSQLGRDGAVVKYFRRAGWKPGMGELDAYSIVNAGAPGRYNASDANNGGAPGTVRDKVQNQFSGHREKATALLGGEYTPAPSGMEAEGPGRVDRNPDRLAWAYANGRMTPEDAAIYERGMAEGTFPKAQQTPAPPPDPLAIYAMTALRPRQPFQPVALDAGQVKNATPFGRV